MADSPAIAALDTKKLKSRREKAKRHRDAFQPMLDEALDYSIPYSRSTKDRGDGEKRVDQVFDHTAIDAAFRFAGNLQQNLWPAGQENFSLEPGPVVVDQAERDRLTQALEPIAKVAQAFFDDGEWDMSFHEMALQLSAGTGAILMNPSEDADELWEPICVPINELLFEGRNNKVPGIFWDRKITLRELFETWPEGDYFEELRQLHRDKPEDEIEIHVDTVHDRKVRRWRMIIWTEKQEKIIYETSSRTRPWLTPRYFRVAGETMGRGLSMLAMPMIKTVNTAARLQLQAAAIAMLGIYTAVDDGVFNPDLAPLEPGMFWKVARNGGVLGPSVQRFPDPRLDLSNLIIRDMQTSIKATMMDQQLPPDSAAVKSATEILERVKRLAADHIGAFGRLIKEIVVPAVQRVIELAYNKGLIQNDIAIDQLLFRVRVKSPLSLAREADRIGKIVQWLQLILAIYASLGQPGRATYVAKIDQALADMGPDMGVPAKYVVTADERQKLIEQDQQRQAAIAAAAALAGGGQAGGMAAGATG